MIFFTTVLFVAIFPPIARKLAGHATRTGLNYIAGSYQRYYWLTSARQWSAAARRVSQLRPYTPLMVLVGLIWLLLT